MEITSNATQTVNSGANVIFTETLHSCPGGAIKTREGSGIVTLMGGRRYFVTFGGNIGLPSTGTAGTIGLAIALQGESIPTSQMLQTAAADSVYNVNASLYVTVPRGCCYTLAVENVSSQAITVSNANLIIEGV